MLKNIKIIKKSPGGGKLNNSIIVESLNGQKNAEFCIIWLHGLGANGHDFETIVPELKTDLAIKYIFPNAPVSPVTVNGGMAMPSWYDIRSMESITENADWQGMQASENYLNQLIEQAEKEGFSRQKILLAGFSQGGVIAYRTALQSAKPLAGIMALSTYLPLEGSENIQQPKNIPIMIAHGTQDPVVPFRAAESANQILTKLGYKPINLSYPMQHQVCYEEIQDMTNFIKEAFK